MSVTHTFKLMDDESDARLAALRKQIRSEETRLMELAMHQAILDRLGKTSDDGQSRLQVAEDDLIKTRATRDLLLFRRRSPAPENGSS